MKKQILSIVLLASCITINAQTWGGSTGQTGNTYRTGNVGIGNTSPLYPLDIFTSQTNGGIRIEQNNYGAAGIWFKNNTSSSGGKQWLFGMAGDGNSAGGASILFFDLAANKNSLVLKQGSGFLGVNTANPEAQLNVVTPDNSSSAFIINHNYTSPYSFAQLIKVKHDQTKALCITRVNGANENVVFQVWGNGVVNTKSLFAEAITVTPTAIGTVWPDYVFKNNYKLMPILELEQYIKKNNHLPNVPSAETVEKDGVNLFEINKALLEKVEELSLYIIELKKELEVIKQKVN